MKCLRVSSSQNRVREESGDGRLNDFGKQRKLEWKRLLFYTSHGMVC